MDKKGEMTSRQIGIIVLALAGFAIMLIFILVVLDLDNFSDDELCRLSILTRATSPEVTKRLAPLNCRTGKICFTYGEKCIEFAGRKYDEEKLPSNPDQAARKIEEITAKEMFDCWSMMGEGKLDIFNGGPLDAINWDFKNTTCMICTRLATAPDVPEEVLRKVDLNKYLESQQVPSSSKTYLQTFTDIQINAYPRDFKENLSKENNNSPAQPTNEIAVLFMQIKTEKGIAEAGLETGVTAATFIFGGTSFLGPLGNVATFKAKTIMAGVVGAVSGGIAALQTYRSRTVSAAYCGELTSPDKAQTGCSVITTFNYKNAEALNKYCGAMENIP